MPGQVLARGRDADALRAEAERARVAVEHRAEHARRVHARQAHPLDRPGRADQRDRLAVRQERVVGDRGNGLGARSTACSSVIASVLRRPWRAPVIAPVGCESSRKRVSIAIEVRNASSRQRCCQPARPPSTANGLPVHVLPDAAAVELDRDRRDPGSPAQPFGELLGGCRSRWRRSARRSSGGSRGSARPRASGRGRRRRGASRTGREPRTRDSPARRSPRARRRSARHARRPHASGSSGPRLVGRLPALGQRMPVRQLDVGLPAAGRRSAARSGAAAASAWARLPA